MERTPAEMMKEYVNSQQFESTADVMAAMKEMFADVVQRMMEGELDDMLWDTKKVNAWEKTTKTRCGKTTGTGTRKSG